MRFSDLYIVSGITNIHLDEAMRSPRLSPVPATHLLPLWGASQWHCHSHSLSCGQSEDHHHHHAAINDVLHQVMSAAHLPWRLEPTVFFLNLDDKCLDGIIAGTLEEWQAVCVRYCLFRHICSFLPPSASQAGTEAALVE